MRRSTEMCNSLLGLFFTLGLFPTQPLMAQNGHFGGHGNLWPDSLTQVTTSGRVIIDSSAAHGVYFLDENYDGAADLLLNFGPWWYQPATGVVRPLSGDTAQVAGALVPHAERATLIIFEINGKKWREAIELGMHGWNEHGFWEIGGDTISVSGIALVDTSYFYPQFFIDVNNDSIPEYRLGFGPPWYQPASGQSRPRHGAAIAVFGRLEAAGPPPQMLIVYRFNGGEWRSPGGPAAWSGTWIHRNGTDSTRVYCLNDSTQWMDFPPTGMGQGMGGMHWPDSVFVQFWRIYPDSLPGEIDPARFMGFYFDLQEPGGSSMMNRGGRMMSFNASHRMVWNYSDDMLHEAGRSEEGMKLLLWNPETRLWQPASGAAINTTQNRVMFESPISYPYYALAAPQITTSVRRHQNPQQFQLLPAYPNPFNPETRIAYALQEPATVELAVFNALGQRMTTLVHGHQSAGSYAVSWDGTNDDRRPVPSGIYFIRLFAGQNERAQRVTLLR